MSKIIDLLSWRYATKRFDSSKKLEKDSIEILKESVRLSPSSYGLQLFKVMVVKDQEWKEKLRPLCWNQPQIEEASHLFIFCNKTKVERSDLDSYLDLKANTQGLNKDSLTGYADFIEGKLKEKTAEEVEAWTSKQTYIAASNLMLAAAEMNIDSCPMEGFEANKVNELFDLHSKGLNAALIVTAGYRSDEDKTQFSAKVRKEQQDLFDNY